MSATAARHESAQEPGVSPVRVFAVVALLIAVLALIALFLLREDTYTVKVELASASLVGEGNVVRIAGRQVGIVTESDLTDEGNAELTLELEEDVAPLRDGTEAHLRLTSLASGRGRYVDLRIPPSGRQGDTRRRHDPDRADAGDRGPRPVLLDVRRQGARGPDERGARVGPPVRRR